jgi:hypothetical protein
MTRKDMLDRALAREVSALQRLHEELAWHRDYASAVAWREMRIANVRWHLEQLPA